MTIRTKTLLLTTFLAASWGASLPVYAGEDSFLGGEFSANISMLNDYRFRGVSLNDEGFTLQGGLDWASDSGFYVGTWASNISDFNGSTLETDFYGGYAGEIEGISFDVGGLLYHYPGGENTDYFEIYGSTGIDLGFVSASVGANYALSSDNLAGQDNIYIYIDGSAAVPDTPVTINLLLGYEDGAFGNNKWNWNIGASVDFKGLELGLSYIDTNQPGDNADATVVFSVGASF